MVIHKGQMTHNKFFRLRLGLNMTIVERSTVDDNQLAVTWLACEFLPRRLKPILFTTTAQSKEPRMDTNPHE